MNSKDTRRFRTGRSMTNMMDPTKGRLTFLVLTIMLSLLSSSFSSATAVNATSSNQTEKLSNTNGSTTSVPMSADYMTSPTGSTASSTDVVPIKWNLFTAGPPSDSDWVAWRWKTLLAGSVNWTLTHWPYTEPAPGGYYPEILGPVGNFRDHTGRALSLAIALKTGVITDSQYDARNRTLTLIKTLALRHKQNSAGGWGFQPDETLYKQNSCPPGPPPHDPTTQCLNWQISWFAAQAGFAGWLMWDDLGFSQQDRENIRRMVEYEADRFINYDSYPSTWVRTNPNDPPVFVSRLHIDYRRGRNGQLDDVYTNHYGDTHAEELAWDARAVQLATAMMPNHPRFDRWQFKANQMGIASFSRPTEDVPSSSEIIHGLGVSNWLNGSNTEPPIQHSSQDGIIIQGGIINPNYFPSIIHKSEAALVSPLSGRPIAKAALFNNDQVYDSLVQFSYPASAPQACSTYPWLPIDLRGPTNPCFTGRSGPIYQADGTINYPMGVFTPGNVLQDSFYQPNSIDAQSRVDIFAQTDTYARVLGFGIDRESGRNNTPATWEPLHLVSNNLSSAEDVKAAESYLLLWLKNQPYVTGGQFPVSDVPTNWRDADVGLVAKAGTGSFNRSTNTFTVKGSGAYTGETEEQLHFTYRVMNGDGEIIARKQSWNPTSSISQAGIMIRESLDAGSRYVRVLFQANVGGGNSPYFKWRSATNQPSQSYGADGINASDYIRLVRSGNLFTGYRWNGAAWIQIYNVTIPMTSEVYVGLAASSLDNSAAVTTASFDNISIKAGTRFYSSADNAASSQCDSANAWRVIDGDSATRWSCDIANQYVRLDLGGNQVLNAVSIEWFQGDQRIYDVDIRYSSNGVDFSPLFRGSSSGTTSGPETYFFTPTSVRYIAAYVHGFTYGPWTSINEMGIYGVVNTLDNTGVDPK
jgi:hypothetical protein